jgi:hypothetical protein
MKKLFFAALVATVAIGGAFSSNARVTPISTGSPLDSDVPCDQYQDLNCNLTGSFTCTTVDAIPLYTENVETGKCQIPLKRDVQ